MLFLCLNHKIKPTHLIVNSNREDLYFCWCVFETKSQHWLSIFTTFLKYDLFPKPYQITTKN